MTAREGAGAGQECAEDCCRAGGSGSSFTEAAGAQVRDWAEGAVTSALQVSGSASGNPRAGLKLPHPTPSSGI